MNRMKIIGASMALCLMVNVLPSCQAASHSQWPTELTMRDHSFKKIGAAIANEPGFPSNGSEAEKATYIYSRLPQVVDYYGLTAGTGSRASDLTVGGLRMFDGVDVEQVASLKSAFGRGNCAEFTFMFQDILTGAGVQGHVIYADNDPNPGYSQNFTGTDTALYVDETGPNGVVVRRVFDAFRAVYHHQKDGKSWKEAIGEWGDQPMTSNDRLSRDPAHLDSWLETLEKKYVKGQETETVLPPNRKAPATTANVEAVLKKVLGLWQSPDGAQLLLRGTNGQIEAMYVKLSPKQRVQGMPDNAYYFRNGTLKLGPPLKIVSSNGFNYAQADCNQRLAPFTKCDCQVSFVPSLDSAIFSRRAPQYWKKDCRWAAGEAWYTEQWKGVRVKETKHAGWQQMVGLWQTNLGGHVRISKSGNELTVVVVKVANPNYKQKPGDITIAHAKPSGEYSVHSNNSYSYPKVADNLKPHDHGTADLQISEDGNTITGKRTLAQYYDGSKEWDAGEISQTLIWKRIGD